MWSSQLHVHTNHAPTMPNMSFLHFDKRTSSFRHEWINSTNLILISDTGWNIVKKKSVNFIVRWDMHGMFSISGLRYGCR